MSRHLQRDPIQITATPTASGTPAADDLLALSYEEVRRIARSYMRQERPNHTLQATALVHEAYLALRTRGALRSGSKADFMRLMAVQMKHHLVDHARRRGARKRGGAVEHVDIASHDVAPAAPDAAVDVERLLEQLDRALEELRAAAPRQARALEERFFAGRSIGEASSALGVSPGTLKREIAAARAWLAQRIATT